MANRTLTPEEREVAKKIFAGIEKRLDKLAGKNDELKFAYRRKISRLIIEVEKGTVGQHNKLKKEKWMRNGGRCEYGRHSMPSLRGSILHRHSAIAGYTAKNTILVCAKCHDKIHSDAGWH